MRKTFPSPFFPSVVFAILATLLLAPVPARALFYAASRAVRAADAHVEEGKLAVQEGRYKDAEDAFDAALNAYANLRERHPDVQPEHVAEQSALCREQLIALFAMAENIEAAETRTVTVPVGEPITENLPQNEVHAPPAPTTLREAAERRAAPPRKGVEPLPPPVPLAADDEAKADLAIPTGLSLQDRVAFQIRNGQAAAAVVDLDALIGDSPETAPPLYRLLLARALVASKNYVRAIAILDPLAQELPTDPSVLTLAAGAHLAHGNAYSALQHLDNLVRAHPKYADAYIDLAYTRFAMDPVANRDEAIVYYKYALSFGAVRDRRLEDELGVRIQP